MFWDCWAPAETNFRFLKVVMVKGGGTLAKGQLGYLIYLMINIHKPLLVRTECFKKRQ